MTWKKRKLEGKSGLNRLFRLKKLFGHRNQLKKESTFTTCMKNKQLLLKSHFRAFGFFWQINFIFTKKKQLNGFLYNKW